MKMEILKVKRGLGFRDLESFNTTLLVKQAWRFLHNPNSMAAVICREKYLSKTSILVAKLGSRPSMIWRRI